MRKPAEFPTPKLNKRNDSYRIRWFRRKKLYEITLGVVDKDEAKATLAVIAASLAKLDWPSELLAHPTVKRYLADIAGTVIEGCAGESGAQQEDGDWRCDERGDDGASGGD